MAFFFLLAIKSFHARDLGACDLTQRHGRCLQCIKRKKGTMVADKKTRLSTAREELNEEKPQRENKSMDAFEVVSREEEKMTAIERRNDDEDDAAIAAEEEEKESKAVAVLPVSPVVDHLKVKLLEKEKEAEILVVENAILKTNAEAEAKKMAGAARAKEAELMAKLESTEEELKASRAKADRLAEQLEAAEGAKAALEAEMRRLRAQTEQWRKAAEAGAAALDEEGRSCGSMDRRLEAWHVGWGSPLMAGDMDDDGAGGAACGGIMKGGGVWTVVDIWKKKKKGGTAAMKHEREEEGVTAWLIITAPFAFVSMLVANYCV